MGDFEIIGDFEIMGVFEFFGDFENPPLIVFCINYEL